MPQNLSDCAICQGRSNPDRVEHLIYEDAYWRVRHSGETNVLGYLVLESQRHFLDLSESGPEESRSYGCVLAAVMKAVRATIDCRRIYTFTLAEAVPHYHIHVIPITSGLPRAFRGRGIMSYPLKPAADPALVKETCSRLRRALCLAMK